MSTFCPGFAPIKNGLSVPLKFPTFVRTTASPDPTCEITPQIIFVFPTNSAVNFVHGDL